MGLTINRSTKQQQLSRTSKHPIMKFVLSLVVLALVAAVNVAPAPEFAAGGDLDLIQASLVDIEVAASDLNIMETRLGDLEVAKDTILAAELALETAVSAAGYSTS